MLSGTYLKKWSPFFSRHIFGNAVARLSKCFLDSPVVFGTLGHRLELALSEPLEELVYLFLIASQEVDILLLLLRYGQNIL